MYMTEGYTGLVFIKYDSKCGYKGYSFEEVQSEFKKYRAYTEYAFFDKVTTEYYDIYIHVNVPDDKLSNILKSPYIFNNGVDKKKQIIKNRLLGIKVGDINIIQDSIKDKYNLYTYRDMFVIQGAKPSLWVFNPYIEETDFNGIYEGFLRMKQDKVSEVRQMFETYYYFNPDSFVFSQLYYLMVKLKRESTRGINDASIFDNVKYSYNITKEYIACKAKTRSVRWVAAIYYKDLNNVVLKDVGDNTMKQRGIKLTLSGNSIIF